MKINLHRKEVPLYKQFSFLYIPLFFWVCAVLLDVIMYAFMDLPFASHYAYSLVIMLLVCALISMTQRKWLQIVLTAILLGVQIFTCASNILSYQSLDEIFSWETINSIGNAATAATSVQLDLSFIFPVVIVVLLYIIGVTVIAVKCKTPRVKHRFWQPLLCLALIFGGICGQTLVYVRLPDYNTTYVKNLTNEKYLYNTFNNRIQTFKRFGSYSYYLDNVLYLMSWKASPNKILGVDVNPEFTADTNGYDQVAQLGAGDNLIMILMETFEQSAINPYTMPNLYHFMQESCDQVEGYYSIERTCFTDYISQTGMNALGKEMWSSYGNVEIPFSLPNIFKRANADGESNYTTNVFHDGNGDFYQRKNLFTKALGFDHFYDYKAITSVKPFDAYFNGNKDEYLFKDNLEKIAPTDQNFYSFLISISTHGLSAGIDLSKHYPEEFKYIDEQKDNLVSWGYEWLESEDPDRVQVIKNYLAGCISFDNGFGALLERLKTQTGVDGRPLIESTAIVLFGDHYYYLNSSALVPETANPNQLIGNKCPFIVYNPKTVDADTGVTMAENAQAETPAELGRTIKRFTATMDIYKTVCSMFGIVTDQQLTYGHSIYGDQKSIGVGYVNSYIWGQVTRDGQIYSWRTIDFKDFNGITLTNAEKAQIEPVVNQTFNSIICDMMLLERNGFKKLEKCYYQLPTT